MAKKSGSLAAGKGRRPRLDPGETPRRKSRAVPVLAGLGLALALGAARLPDRPGTRRFRGPVRRRPQRPPHHPGHDPGRPSRLLRIRPGPDPRLDGLARDGVRFARVYCPARSPCRRTARS
ncbi:MAG: hypothetical protein M0C28_24375 [Candidatus Moduliflexus flocculans]|nr:hypothetical protein [Candidatus Moduliflexus flocculans]